MPVLTDELTYVSFPIHKWEKTDDGDLVVYGKATDGSVDSDDQIVDPGWSANALAKWMDTGGNVRVQHQALRDPAGKGIAVEVDRDGDGGHWVKSLIVEPVAKRLVEKGVLTAYSIGIARPVINRDPSGKARGGIVAGGHLAELSLVDRPANKQCRLEIAKSEAGGSPTLTGELFGAEQYMQGETGPGVTKVDGADETVGKAASRPDPDVGAETQGGQAADSAHNDPGGDNDPADDDSDDSDDEDTVKAFDALTAAAPAAVTDYRTARRGWLSGEPSVKNAIGGTEYLSARADWMKWHREGLDQGLDGSREGAEKWLAKRDFSASERRQAAGSGAAMSDGSFPIKTGEDLGNAIHLAGHAKDPSKARAHIKRRAAALGMADRIPDSWKSSTIEELVKAISSGLMTVDQARGILGYEPWGPGAFKTTAPSEDAAETQEVEEPEVEKTGTGGKKAPPFGKNPDGDDDSDDSDDDEGKKADTGWPGGDDEAGQKPQMGAKPGKKPKKAPKYEAALQQVTEDLIKRVGDGTITAEAAAGVWAQISEALKTTRPLPSDTRPAGQHREPDGTSTVEQMEPQAGMHTDPDATADHVPSSLASEWKGDTPAYTTARMHDLLCAAFDPAETLAAYPALKTWTDGLDSGWFTGQAEKAVAAGDAASAATFTTLAGTVAEVKGMDPAAAADGLALLHKAFTDMYPSEHCSPSSPPAPGQYQRPYISTGHASPNAGHKGSPDIPSPTHTPEPEQFHRPLITDGHEADSPANAGMQAARPAPTTGSARTYYTRSARDQARTALAAMHDHIAGSFPDLCPMAASKSVMPPDLGAHNVPTPAPVRDQGGIRTVGKTAQAVDDGALKLFRKALKKSRQPQLAPVPPPAAAGLDAETLKAILAEQITTVIEKYETQLNDLRKQIDELGSKPDPALAPVRGSIARTVKTEASPVERRSLVEEAAANARDRAAAEELAYRTYVQQQARSADPGTREKALAVLSKMGADDLDIAFPMKRT